MSQPKKVSGLTKAERKELRFASIKLGDRFKFRVSGHQPKEVSRHLFPVPIFPCFEDAPTSYLFSGKVIYVSKEAGFILVGFNCPYPFADTQLNAPIFFPSKVKRIKEGKENSIKGIYSLPEGCFWDIPADENKLFMKVLDERILEEQEPKRKQLNLI